MAGADVSDEGQQGAVALLLREPIRVAPCGVHEGTGAYRGAVPTSCEGELMVRQPECGRGVRRAKVSRRGGAVPTVWGQ